MRWKAENEPNIEDTRECRWFAFRPVTIKDETRWLEYVTVQQRYVPDYAAPQSGNPCNYTLPMFGFNIYWYRWKNICFID